MSSMKTSTLVRLTLLCLTWIVVGAGCASQITAYEHPKDEDADLIQTTYNAVDCLLQRSSGTDRSKRILVASAVNLNNVRQTSTFGRLIGELLSTRLAHHGYAVVEPTVRQGSVMISDEGQFLLSRNMQDLARDYNAGAVLVSTYTPAQDKVYVSAKLVNADFNTLVAAVDYALPFGPRTKGLLNIETQSMPGAYPAPYSSFPSKNQR